MTTFLETPRLYITVPAMDDLANLYKLQADPEVMQFVGNGVRSLDETREGLEKALLHQQRYGFSLGSVYEKEGNAFVGRAGIIYLAFNDAQPEIEIGYGLHKVYWGRGYATELAKGCIEWGFRNIAVDMLVGITNLQNLASQCVLQKAGMSYRKNTLYCGKEVKYFAIEKAA